MAQTIDEIQQGIVDSVQTDETLGPLLTSVSRVAIWRLITYVVAVCAWVQQTLFDEHVEETEAIILAKNPPSRYWYQQKCLDFQYGFPLLPESDVFDNTGKTQQQIDDSKVVKYAAIVKQVNSFGRITLIAKVAGVDGDDNVAQLDDDVVDALQYYFDDEKVAPAGDNVLVQSGPADKIKTTWLIQYNPLVLNADGQRIDGSDNTPVQDAIKEFLQTVYTFGGKYVPTFHIDFVQKVSGVVEPQLLECYGTYGALPWTAINSEYVPNSGYLKFYDESDLTITFQASDL